MRIIVVGLGSMGRRRIRLLRNLSKNAEIIGIDAREDRRIQAQQELGVHTEEDLSKALNTIHPDCAIVCTSPISHGAIIEKCLKADCNVFTELNLVPDKYETNMALAKEKKKALFLSSTFLYRKEIEYISSQVALTETPLNYRYHVGQYLPDWHPWESINDYFIGDKKTNGCRELLAIELPWICRVFGEVSSVTANKRKTTRLNIDYEDTYQILLDHENGSMGALCVDVVSRKPVRNLEIYNEELYINWNGTPDGLFQYDVEKKEMVQVRVYDHVEKREGYANFVIENAYQSELEVFLSEVMGNGKPRYTFEDDLKILELISKIEGEN